MASTLAKSRALNFFTVEHSQKGRDIVRTHNHGASQPFFFLAPAEHSDLALGVDIEGALKLVITGLMLPRSANIVLSWADH